MATKPRNAAQRQPLGHKRKGETPEIIREQASQRPFLRVNLYMMAACIALIVAGFLLMLGGGSSIEGGFNPDIFATRRIAVGPALTFLGFLLMAFAIIWHPARTRKNEKAEDTPADGLD